MMLTLLASAVLLAATPVQVPPGWAIVGDQVEKYFVADPGNVVRRELVESRNVGTQIDRRDERVSEERLPVKVTKSEDSETATKVVNPADRRLEGRYMRTYEIKQVDTIKVITTVTRYADYRVTDYEKLTRTQYLNTYAVTTLYSWTDPYTGETISHKVRVVEAPRREEVSGEWEPAQDRVKIGEGTTSRTDREIVASRTVDRLLATSAAPSGIEAETIGSARATDMMISSGDAGRGSQGGKAATAGKAFSLSGSPRARSSGGLRVGGSADLFALAAHGTVLVDEAGIVSWKLGLNQGAVLFTPFDAAGALHAESAVRVEKELKPAGGAGGAVVRITSVSAGNGGSAVLAGTFKNPYLDKGKGSSYLASR